MRYSEIARQRKRKVRVTITLCFLLAIALTFAISSGALDNFFGWFMELYTEKIDHNRVLRKLPEEKPSIEGEIADPDTEGELTEKEIELPAKTYYLVQMGAFTDEDNARMAAEELQKLGGAGYVHFDGYYRVFAMV